MDKRVEERRDSIVEGELVRGYRVVELPADVLKQCQAAGVPVKGKVRFSALNPARRRDMNDIVQRRFHRNMMDADVFSDQQILQAAEKRGQWSRENMERMQELQGRTLVELAGLWADGYTPEGVTWRGDMVEKHLAVVERAKACEVEGFDRDRFVSVLQRWVLWRDDKRDAYDRAYAADQDLPTYSIDRDHSWLLDTAPGMEDVEAIQEIAELRDKTERLDKLNLERAELGQLSERYARLVAGTAESKQRADEEMALLYYTCDVLTDDERPNGKLATTFDGLWDYPQDAIAWLMAESHYFHHQVPDDLRQMMNSFSFRRADQETRSPSGESAPSGESPDPQSSSTDGASAAETPSSSSASPADRN